MARQMKDSGIEWIGKIPEDWKSLPFKHTFFSTNSGEVIDKNWWNCGEELLYTCQRTPMKSNFDMFPISKRTKKGDLLLTRNATPYVFIPEENAIYSNVVQRVVMNTKDYDIRYIKYILKQAADAYGTAAGISIPSYNMEIWGNLKIINCSIEEQQKIADFLDEKVVEIDNVINTTKATIEDYKNYKQSLITEAVTKGIHNDICKQTGNIHIPEIPENWEMKKMKYIFYIKKDIAGEEGYDILSITQKGIKVKDITSNEGQLAADYSKYQLVNAGDFAMNHMDLLTGWVDVSAFNGVTSPDYRVFNFINEEGYNRRYYLYLMQMCYMDKIFYGLGQGVSNLGRWRLQADKFLNFRVPVPSESEQEEIANYLDEKCIEIDNLISAKEQLIEDMESYKKSLIYEYVTGKKEVSDNE